MLYNDHLCSRIGHTSSGPRLFGVMYIGELVSANLLMNAPSFCFLMSKPVPYSATTLYFLYQNSILSIIINEAFDNVHKSVCLKTMSDMELPEASRC